MKSIIPRVKNGSKTLSGIKKMGKKKMKSLELCDLHDEGMSIVRTQILKAKV